MLSSSNPDRRVISRRASRIIDTQLATMARVRAISITISPKRTLFRFMARRIGPNSRAAAAVVVLELMGRLLLQLEVDRGRDAADAPGRVEAGHETREQGQEDREQRHREVELE